MVFLLLSAPHLGEQRLILSPDFSKLIATLPTEGFTVVNIHWEGMNSTLLLELNSPSLFLLPFVFGS